MIDFCECFRRANQTAHFHKVGNIAIKQPARAQQAANASKRAAHIEEMLETSAKQDQIESFLCFPGLHRAGDRFKIQFPRGGPLIGRRIEYRPTQVKLIDKLSRDNSRAASHVEQLATSASCN